MIMTSRKMHRKSLVVGCGLILLLTGCNQQAADSTDIVNYEGTDYAFVEYPANIFYYDYNGNSSDNFVEVDGIYPIASPQWDMIWNGGDLYCDKNAVEEASSYYANDDNYDWYVVIDTADEELSYPVNIMDEELDAIYSLEDMEKDKSVFWEEFEAQGSLVKISKDGIVRGTLSIAKCDGSWYWKSELIDESREEDGTWPEYVQPLPESLDSKIKEVE